MKIDAFAAIERWVNLEIDNAKRMISVQCRAYKFSIGESAYQKYLLPAEDFPIYVDGGLVNGQFTLKGSLG
jgi:hypothetical protein